MADWEPPRTSAMPSLAPLAPWFELVRPLDENTELLHDGRILDGLQVADAESARLALTGHRFVLEQEAWLDLAERGAWNVSWIVIGSVGGDPFVADLTTAQVRVLHGPVEEGAAHFEVAAESLQAFIGAIEVNEGVPGPPEDERPRDGWSVRLVGLGDRPMQTLVRLRSRYEFAGLNQRRLLAVRDRLPVTVIDGVPEELAAGIAADARADGFDFEATRTPSSFGLTTPW